MSESHYRKTYPREPDSEFLNPLNNTHHKNIHILC